MAGTGQFDRKIGRDISRTSSDGADDLPAGQLFFMHTKFLSRNRGMRGVFPACAQALPQPGRRTAWLILGNVPGS